jgi:hypothetical protein
LSLSRSELPGISFIARKIFSVLCAELENRFDVWMIQLGKRQCLFPEQLTGSFVGNGAARQDLERSVAVQLVIVGAVHFVNSSYTDLFDDVVMAEGLANHLEEPPMRAILGRTPKQVNVGVGKPEAILKWGLRNSVTPRNLGSESGTVQWPILHDGTEF